MERPILFTGANIRAILEGRKTQTRRVFKDTTEHEGPYNPAYLQAHRGERGWAEICPYGAPGDRLWVRETFALECDQEYVGESEFEDWRDGRPFQTHPGDDDRGTSEYHTIPRYRATEPDTLLMIKDAEEPEEGMAWTPSIFMPRWASRITLEITGVRVERVQDISHKDALAEGVEYDLSKENGAPVPRFMALWDSINGKKHPWASNPWVWALTFRKL